MRILEEVNEELERLRPQMDRVRKLEAVIEDLRSQHSHRRQAVAGALEVLHREELDVEELERLSFTSLLSKLRGDREERLSKERREAVAAKARYDAAQRDLDDLEYRFRTARKERDELREGLGRYQHLMQEKEKIILQTNAPQARDLDQILQQMTRLESQCREIDEAVSAGSNAVERLEEMNHGLDEAEGWGIWDVMGGGFFATMAKHESLDEAQQAAFLARQAISQFRTELADVSRIQVPQLEISDFATFADYFFDGFFADIFVQEQIGQAQAEVARCGGEVLELVRQLQQEQSQLEARKQTLTHEREVLLVGG